jgi:hypothetical protein
MDLEVTGAKYNLKYGDYHSWAQSKTSTDTRFSVSWSNGKVTDSYEYDVKNHYMTYQRLCQELAKEIEDIISREFPYETSIVIGEFMDDGTDFSRLIMDQPLDSKYPPYPVELTVYILTSEVSYENLSARLLELSDIMGKHEIPVSMYSVVLQEPLPEGEKAAPGGQDLYLYDFPADKLKEPDLLAAIKEHQAEYEDEHSKE